MEDEETNMRKIGDIIQDSNAFGLCRITDIYLSQSQTQKFIYEIETEDGMIAYCDEAELEPLK